MFATIDARLRFWHVIMFWGVAGAAGAFLGLVSVPHLRELAGGLDPFDMRMTGYSYDEAVRLLGALGEEGSRYYRSVQIPVDIIFPPAEFLALSALFLWLTKPGRRFALPLPDGLRLLVVAVALVGFLGDWGENIVQFVMLSGSGDPANTLAHLGSALTVIKGFALILAMAAVAVTAILAVIRGLMGSSAPA